MEIWTLRIAPSDERCCCAVERQWRLSHLSGSRAMPAWRAWEKSAPSALVAICSSPFSFYPCGGSRSAEKNICTNRELLKIEEGDKQHDDETINSIRRYCRCSNA